MNIQRRSIEDMSPKEIRLNLYVTQLIIIGVGLVLSYILFPNMNEFYDLWKWEPVSILIIGSGVACSIVLLDYIAMHVFPESWFDDGELMIGCFKGFQYPAYCSLRWLLGQRKNFYFEVYCKLILDLSLRVLFLLFYISDMC